MSEGASKVFDQYAAEMRYSHILTDEHMKEFCNLCAGYSTYLKAISNHHPESKQIAESIMSKLRPLAAELSIAITANGLESDQSGMNFLKKVIIRGMEKETRMIKSEVRSIPANVDETRTIEFVISTERNDRHGTVLNIDG